MNTLPARPGHRSTVWPYLVVLALAPIATLAPSPADAARNLGMRPTQAFRMQVNETRDALQAGDFLKAESLARYLYEHYRDSGNDIESSAATTLLGRVLREMGKYAEAETLLRQSLSRWEKLFGEADSRALGGRIQLARVLIPLGRYAEADVVVRRAHEIQQRAGRRGSREELVTVNLLGLVQLQLGRLAEAEALLKKALADTEGLDDKKGSHARSATMYLLARTLNTGNKFPEAEKYARASVALRAELGGKESAEVAKTELVLGRALIGQNKLAEAETVLRRALAVGEKTLGPSHNETAKIVAALAYLAGLRGQTAEAGAYLKRAADSAREANVPAQTAHAMRAYARFLIKQNRAREALPHYREALDAVDRLFANTRGLDESVREGFIAQYTDYYQEMTELLLRLHGNDPARGHDREALAVVSRTQSRLFTELLRQADVGKFSNDSAFLDLKRNREALLERTNLLYAQHYSREGRDTADLSPRAAGMNALDDDDGTALPKQVAMRPIQLAQQELAGIEGRLWKDYPRYMELTQPKPVTVEDLQKRLLRPGEALLAYTLLKDKIAVFAVTSAQFRLSLVPQSREQIGALIRNVRRPMELVAASGAFAALDRLDPKDLHQLYQALVAPAEPVLKGTQRVLLVGDGPIHTLPLEMLVTRYGNKESQTFVAARRAGGPQFGEYATLSYLGDSYRFAYLPSLAALSTQRLYPKRGTGYDRELVSFADPVFENEGGSVGEATRGALAVLARSVRGQEAISIPRLPETADEAREIAQTLGGRNDIYLREQAQEKTAKTLNLKTTRYLHFATHGLLGGEFLQVKESAKGGGNGYLLPDERTRTLAVVASSKPTEKPEEPTAPSAPPTRRGQPALVLTLVGSLKGEDGLLTMREVIEDLDINAELVVLSACNTAGESAEAQNGEGFAGLTRGFMYAGAKGLLVSHWSVESLSAKDLINDSFRHLKAGEPPAEALRAARLTVRASRDTGARFSRAHPYFWAPFVYVGD